VKSIDIMRLRTNMVRMEKIKSLLKTRVKSALGSYHGHMMWFGPKAKVGLRQTTTSVL
jgi:hypothetical protein